jgi:hypothetical protein
LTYEELAADYTGTVIRTLAFLGVTLRPEEVPPPEMVKQADSRSQEWEQRYREEEQAGLAQRRPTHERSLPAFLIQKVVLPTSSMNE